MKKFAIGIFTLFLVIPAFLSAQDILQEQEISEAEKKAIDAQAEVMSAILRLYAEEALLRPADLSGCLQEMIAMRRMGKCRDEFSRYISPEEVKLDRETADGEFEGVGMEVTERDGFVVVVTPIKNSPAQKSGIKPEDIIVEVDDKEVKGLNDAVRKIRGPRGSKVKIKIFRKGSAEPLFFEITRENIVLRSIEVEKTSVRGQEVEIVKVNLFAENASKQFRQALLDLKKTGIKNIVIDLRNNPGGRLDVALGMLALFMKPTDIAITYKTRHLETVYDVKYLDEYLKYFGHARNFGEFLDFKAVILINKGSASASELFAGAMKDWGYKIVGEKSFCKGVGQTVFPLPDGSEFWLTTFEFLVGNSKTPIRDKCVSPDIEVTENPDPKTGQDKQLDKALEILVGGVK